MLRFVLGEHFIHLIQTFMTINPTYSDRCSMTIVSFDMYMQDWYVAVRPPPEPEKELPLDPAHRTLFLYPVEGFMNKARGFLKATERGLGIFAFHDIKSFASRQTRCACCLKLSLLLGS